MPFGGAQVIIQLIDYDSGDEEFYGDLATMNEFLQQRLMLFKVIDKDRGKDRLELTFRNDDFKMIDSPVFAKGQKLLVSWGWPGEMKPPRRFVIQKVTGSNPVTIVGHCRLSLLDKDRKSRLFENMTDSEIVTQIAEEYGFIGEYQWIQMTNVRRDVNQGRRTDARFINWLARRNGFVFYEDASGFHWHERNTGIDAMYWYIYRTDSGRGDVLTEPQFEINMSRGISKVKVMFRDPRTKEYGEVSGGPDDTEMNSLGEEDEMGNPDDPDQGRRADRMTRVDTRYEGVITEEEAKVIADSRYRMTAEKKYKMSVQVIGNKVVGAKIVVGWVGISDVLDGLYYIKECEDIIAGGKFVQNLKCQKNALNKVKTAKKSKPGTKAKKNPGVIDLGESLIEGNIPKLTKALTVTTAPDGTVIPAYTLVDESGYTPGALTTLNEAELEALNDRELDALFQAGAQSAEPDSAY